MSDGTPVCTMQEVTAIEILEVTDGGWLRTTACGGGVIHRSQVRFN